MAESLLKSASNAGERNANEDGNNMECAVCLQPCVHPAQLPCGHIFCYLCIKGFAHKNQRCAICRRNIPTDFMEHPRLLEKLETLKTSNDYEGFQWFYEGKDGWWMYDERTAEEIEEAHKLAVPKIQLLICGNLFIIDLVHFIQYPVACPNRIRAIKREKPENIKLKGIAGLRTVTSK